MNRNALIAQLKIDEGFTLKPYRDSVGKLTIGCGRNLDDVGISVVEGDLFLDNDVESACQFLTTHLPWWTALDDVRQNVLVNMTFNMRERLLGFVNMLAALQSGNWQKAHDEMLQSEWARQVGARAQRLAELVDPNSSPPHLTAIEKAR